MQEYEIEHQSGISIIRLNRKLEFDEITKIMRDVSKETISKVRLWDMAAGYDYSSGQIQSIADLGKQLWPNSARVAFLVKGDLAFGLVRMMEAYRDQEGYLTHAFTDETEAIRWLKLGVAS